MPNGCTPLSDEVKRQLELLENSQRLLLPLFLSLALQYRSIGIQKEQLLCPDGPAQCEDTKSMQLAASLATFYSLLGYQKQTNEINCTITLAGGCPDNTTAGLGLVVIAVAVIRYIRLLESTAEGENITAEILADDI